MSHHTVSYGETVSIDTGNNCSSRDICLIFKEQAFFAFPKRICYTNKISATYYGINKFRKRILWKKLFLEDRHWKIRS